MEYLAETIVSFMGNHSSIQSMNNFLLSNPIAADPPFPNWGGNATHFGFSVNATFDDTADSPEHPIWNFTYYYDWNLKAERYDHELGQHIDVC